MPTPDFLGARGSNAGDDFHELWVLRHALELLDPETELKTVTAEGLIAEDENGTSKDTWDGVDCAFYYGELSTDQVDRIVVDQVKYSSADPENSWTVSRLTKTTNKSNDNSVIGRLGKVFAGLKGQYPDAIKRDNVRIRLISNQPVSSAVVAALKLDETPKSEKAEKDRTKITEASGLDADSFSEFACALDLSQCGTDSRFAVEEKIRLKISEWTEDDARSYVNDLLAYVRRHMMMPETKGEVITKQSILAHLGFADVGGLFPCPSRVEKIDEIVPRDATQRLLEALKKMTGNQKIAFHGEGGCGKTTALQELQSLLPRNSTVLFFDCYGAGTYLDSDAYRHLPSDAFLQLSNDLARLLRTPLFVRRGDDTSPARAFHKRLVKASEIVSAKSPEALLVVIIDAADNSITAARTRVPPDRSFVHEIAGLGSLPENVRLLISARSGRLSELNLPKEFSNIPVGPFARDETALHVRSRFPDASDQWIDDFHHYSSGTPRVQRYAFGENGTTKDEALSRLLPNGKLLPEVFEAQLARARNLTGDANVIEDLCAAAVTLPRPIPAANLAAVTGLSELYVRDICGDLRPGIRLHEGLVSFGDEDFEAFLRERAESNLTSMRARIAEHFIAVHETNAYAATHIAASLYDAGLNKEVLDLVNTDQVLAIGDPVLKRETQMQRFRIAMKVCRQTGNDAEAIMTLIRGAEALKTDTAILNTLIENPDLAVQFARNRSGRVILRDPEYLSDHGRLLFQRIVLEARQGNGIAAREGFRQLDSWLERRRELIERSRAENYPGRLEGWEIEHEDIAAQTEAILRLAGPDRALGSLLGWRPRKIAIGVAGVLAENLLSSGDQGLLSDLAQAAKTKSPWDLFLQTPLAIAGLDFDAEALQNSLKKIGRTRFIRVGSIERVYGRENATADFHEIILSTCEVLVAKGIRSKIIVKALELLSDPAERRRDRMSTYVIERVEICLRAHVLLERMEGRTATVHSFLIDPTDEAEKKPDNKGEKHKEKSELESLLDAFLPLFNVRAGIVARDLKEIEEIGDALRAAISKTWQVDYQLRRETSVTSFRHRSALAVAKLTMMPDLDLRFILDSVKSVLGNDASTYGSKKIEILSLFTKFADLDATILDDVSKMVESIKKARMPATEKISGLIELARTLVSISSVDAESVFSDAMAVAADVDEDAIHELGVFDALASKAAVTIDSAKRRTVATSLAKIVSDTSVRLYGIDGFPWVRTMSALTTLDPNVALAACCRWEDDNIVGINTTLEPVLIAALQNGNLTPEQATAFLAFLEEPSTELIGQIMDSSVSTGPEISQVVDVIARDELFHYRFGKKNQTCDLLSSPTTNRGAVDGRWFRELRNATSFVSHIGEKRSRTKHEKESRTNSDEDPIEAPDLRTNPADDRDAFLRNAIDWTSYRFIESDDIQEVLKLLRSLAKSKGEFVPYDTLFEAIANNVGIPDRVAHLNALRFLELPGDDAESIGIQINRRLVDWADSPSVVQWGSANRLALVMDRLPAFTRYMKYGDSKTLERLLQNAGATDELIASSLIGAVETHVDSFDAPTIYSLIGLIVKYCDTNDAAKVLEWYVKRLLDRIPTDDIEKWTTDDLPEDLAKSLARFTYSQLGDIDIRKRWRGAHVLRRLTRLGDNKVLDETFDLFDRKVESCFRRPQASFYWLAARMWLLIAADRIASETPVVLVPNFEKIVYIATDKSFPHLLIRDFAKSAAIKLIESGVVNPSGDVGKTLRSVNTSSIRKLTQKDRYGRSFEKYQSPGVETRFRFDEMDTLPYWYSRAIRLFAKLDKKTFLETADKWITDEWGISSEPWFWRNDQRNDRLEATPLSLYSASHGSHPTVERLSTHLEWHAMWCTVGELMETYPLAKPDTDDDHEPISELINTEGLSQPPNWLSDGHSVKPLEERYWFEPDGKVDDWLEAISDADFLAELFPGGNRESAIVACDIATRSSKFRETVSIASALVESSTASALMRALQTAESSHDYKLPVEGEEFELKDSPYVLKGWLKYGDRHLAADERDPFRREILPVQIEPSSGIISEFDLRFENVAEPTWLRSGGTVGFSYRLWSESRWDDARERPYYSGVHSDGYRLMVTPELLHEILTEKKMDLIVEVRIQKRNRDYEYSGHSKEEAKETEFDRIFIFRSDGSIETADGCVGTWKASGSRA